MLLFRDIILRIPIPIGGDSDIHVTIESILHAVILDQVHMERDGDIIDKGLIRSCVYLMEGLYETVDEREDEKIYLTSFEPKFLAASREFYQVSGMEVLRSSDVATYLRYVERKLNEEKFRCSSTLSELSTAKIRLVVEHELIRKPITELMGMESGVKYMVLNDQLSDLKRLYTLISQIDPKTVDLINALQKEILEMGGEINTATSAALTSMAAAKIEKGDGSGTKPAVPAPAAQQTTAAVKWVDEVLQLKDKFDAIWEKSFAKDQGIQTAQTKSFSEFINSFPRSSEFMSLFIDDNLKRGLKGKTENEVDEVLEKSITLLRYVQDKDLFERYYKKHLSRRLLMGRSVSAEVEQQMISRMKIEVGNNFTLKLEGMFKDMKLSEDLTSGYKTHVAGLDADRNKKKIDLSIHVLTQTFWPQESMASSNDETSGCVFPPDVDKLKASFENYYLSKHNGRKLTWRANLGSADIRATFPAVSGAKEGSSLGKERRHEINVSTYAMAILLLFNDLPPGESLSYEDIHAMTMIPPNDLRRNLLSLAVAPKTRILKKAPMNKTIKDSDRFYFHESFSNPFLKVKVGLVAGGSKVESDNERVETERKNDEMRAMILEASIVKIMKQVSISRAMDSC
jgi:cullin 3